MRFGPRTAIAVVALAAIAAITLAACSSKDNPTAPGGGSSGGPSFSFSFPTIGDSHTATFPNAGTFNYHCIPHQAAGMTGVVNVATGNPLADTVEVGPGGATVFSPNSVTIAPGGTVTWVRPVGSTLSNHTATR